MNKLKEKADKVFSKYVRHRDRKQPGNLVRCCTCGKWDAFFNMQCGHYLSRRYLSVRYEEANTGVQCVKCNIFGQGEQAKFREYLVKRYGEKKVQEIERKKNNIVKDARLLYNYVIQEYTRKLNYDRRH